MTRRSPVLPLPQAKWMSTSTAVVETAVVAAVGYAIADGLARVAVYAEKVEEDGYLADAPH